MMILRRWIKRGKGIRIAAVSIILAVALVASGCATASYASPAVGKEIPVGVRAGFTGGAASTLVHISSGYLDCLKYQNDYREGVNGIPIKIMWEDNRSDGLKEISSHKRFATAGAVVEWAAWTTGADATAVMQQRGKIPLMSTAGFTPGQVTKPLKWCFNFVPAWCAEFATAVRWIKEGWTEPRRPRVGLMFWNTPDGWSSKDGIPYCEKAGAEFVGYEAVPLVGAIDLSTELLRLAGKKPDWIYVVDYGSCLVTLMKDAARLEIQQKGIKLIGSMNNIDAAIIGIVKKDAEDWYVLTTIPSAWESTDKYPGLKEVHEAAKRYRGLEVGEIAEMYIGGYMLSKATIEIIRRAIERVGIENLTGEAVRDSAENFDNFNPGMLPQPLGKITRDDPHYVKFYLVYQIQSGKRVLVADVQAVTLGGDMGIYYE